MNVSKDEYRDIHKKLSPASPSGRNIPAAFLVGGLICALGQWLGTAYRALGLDAPEAATAVSCTLIFAGVLLTGLGLYEKIALFAGAGTLVPITGFANSVAAPAIEFKTEGYLLGTCVKMFTIAGPVLTLGISASVAYGLIYYFIGGAGG